MATIGSYSPLVMFPSHKSKTTLSPLIRHSHSHIPCEILMGIYIYIYILMDPWMLIELDEFSPIQMGWSGDEVIRSRWKNIHDFLVVSEVMFGITTRRKPWSKYVNMLTVSSEVPVFLDSGFEMFGGFTTRIFENWRCQPRLVVHFTTGDHTFPSH